MKKLLFLMFLMVLSTNSYSVGNMVPATDSQYSVGTSLKKWATGYFDTLQGDGSQLTGIVSGGDNFGNHIATQPIDMATYGINMSSDISGVRNLKYSDGSVSTTAPVNQIAAGTNITISEGADRIITINSTGGGGGSGYTTSYILLSGGTQGDVYVSSLTRSGICSYRIERDTYYIVNVVFYTNNHSTTGSTYFEIGYSSATGTNTYWDFMFDNQFADGIEVSTNTQRSNIAIPTKYTVLYPGDIISLQLKRHSTTGALASDYGGIICAYRKNE